MRNPSPRIFVMDDEQSFLDEMTEMLSLSGYHVGASSDNEKAVDRIKEFNPDLLLLDLKMAPRSGFQIAHEIKHSVRWRQLIIIGMSGFFLEKEHLTLMNECGITSFLAKPFNPLNLIATIESELDRMNEKSLPRERNFHAGIYLDVSPSMEALKTVTT